MCQGTITGAQVRAARALLGWTAEDAGQAAAITRKTVERFEHCEGVPDFRSDTLLRLRRAFEAAGVEFIGSPEDRPGVRLWPAQRTRDASAD